MHIGIDLGTTFCCVAFIDEGIPQVIPDNRGRNITPSVIWFDGKTAYVGEEANKKKITVFAPIFEFFKRDMGKPTEEMPGKPEFAPYEIGGTKYGAIGMSAILLRKLKRDAWQYFKKRKLIEESTKESEFNIEAVITVPAYFGDEERNATKFAGEIAGLNVINIINEPTAASLTFGISLKENKKILVFDLGGGTLDVTILEIINGDSFKVIATDGNTQLGGKDWDELIIGYLKEKFKKETNSEIPDERFYDLQQLAIQAKKDLSESEETTVFLSDNGFDLEIKLFRSAPPTKNVIQLDVKSNAERPFYFDERSSKLLSASKERCSTVLKASNLSWEEIDEIVLAGGSCRMPMISDMLERESKKTIKKHREGFSYDTAIAIGAAISGQSKGRIEDVAPKSIGVKLVNSKQIAFIDHLIYKNTTLPAKARKQYLTDPYAVLEIYEGESKEPLECAPLGKLELENTGDKATIMLEVNQDGILKVLADYQPEGIKETKINGSAAFPDHLKEKIQSITIIS
ncbi:MAG TPA: Hsp70 family protein [Bacteroidales bacterium]|nr:Hsp70 family protein [Bacteroidales bacterium]